MSFRNKHRWTRRILIGLACGLIVAPAQARPDAGPGLAGDGGAARAQQATDPYLTDVPSRPTVAGVTGVTGPDGAFSGPIGAVATTRPDDRVERFTVTGGGPVTAADDGFAIDVADGFTIGLGALAVALALGIAAAYLRRPRVAL